MNSLKKIILFNLLISICFLNNIQLNDFIRPNYAILNFEEELTKNISIDKVNRKKIFGVGLSILSPGIAHLYLGNKDKAILYTYLDVAGLMVRNVYLDRADFYKDEYISFAENNWSMAKWIKDYFNPTGTLGDDVYNIYLVPNSSNNASIPNYCVDEGDCHFSTPWDQAHKIEFNLNSGFYSTNTKNYR